MKNNSIVIILSIVLLSDALPVFNQLPPLKYIYSEPTATNTPSPAQQPYNTNNVVGSSGDEDCNNEQNDNNPLIVTSNTINTIINKLHTVFVPLNNTVKITWSKCITNIGDSESFLSHVSETIRAENMDDPNVLLGLGASSDKSCLHYQQLIKSSIPFLSCYSKYIGNILTDMTTATLTMNNHHTIRQAVYDSYDNVTVLLDIKKLLDSFPCQISSTTTECVNYNDVQIHYNNDCFEDNAMSMWYTQYKHHIGIIARIALFLRNLGNKLEVYMNKCTE